MKNKMKEIWKDVAGYEGYYQISNIGRLKSLGRKLICKDGTNFTVNEKIIKGSVNSKGYRVVTLSNNRRKGMLMHRLVSMAFIINPKNKPQINHIDCNKLNNNINNLEWCTHRENMDHAFKNGLSIDWRIAPPCHKKNTINIDNQILK